MILQLYIPICLFRVSYEVASGRPFTDLERLLLKALAERSTNIANLAARFCLRDAIVIESIVTLAREGWVALDSKKGCYFITPTGRQAIADSAIPQFLAVKEHQAVVLMERLGGGLAPSSEVRYLRSVDLPLNGHRMEAEWCETRLSVGQVEAYLRSHREGWISWVDVPLLVGLDAYWVQADVDTDTGMILGIPAKWKNSLRAKLHGKASEVAGTSIGTFADTREEVDVIQEGHPVWLAPSHLWLTKEQHAAALLHAFKQAKTFVHVASAFFDPKVLEGAAREAIADALRRGVKVGLLWGYEQGERAKQVVDWLEKFAFDHRESRHLFWFNRTASDSHAKLLAWDEEDGPRVVLGSCNWLSTPSQVSDQTRMNISLCVHDAKVAGELLRAFAGLWLQTGRQDWNPAAEDLFQCASMLSARGSMSSPSEANGETKLCNGSLRMVCDTDHERMMRSLLLGAQHRCWVASHKMADNAHARLASLSHPGRPLNLETCVNYEEEFLGPVSLAELVEEVRLAGGKLAQRESFHAKCIVADDLSMISSFNFLSASPFGSGRVAREIGLVIECSEIANILWEQRTVC